MGIRTKLAFYAVLVGVFALGSIHSAKPAKADESNETEIKLKLAQNISDNSEVVLLGEESGEDELRALVQKELGKSVVVTEEKEQKKAGSAPKTVPVSNKNLPKGKFTINASAYTAAADECGKSDGITASGVKVKENETIACPREYPFGTKVKIEGYGTYVCQDRGGAIKGNKFDIYMETKTEAFAFGRRNLTAEIVKE